MEHRNGVILRYFIGYKRTKANTQFQIKTKDVDLTEVYEDDDTVAILITNLNKFTQYTVNVKSFNKEGMGPASPDIQVFTLEDGKLTNNIPLSLMEWKRFYKCTKLNELEVIMVCGVVMHNN